MSMTIKKYLKKIKYSIRYRRIVFQVWKVRKFQKNKKCIFFIATPNHGNLGDQAIVYAQYQLIHDIGGEKNIIEVTRWEYENLKKKLNRVISPIDIIIIDGGGNIGTLWIEEEYKMRDIIQRFSQNFIFIFPQTAFFSNDEKGNRELQESVKIYKNHKKLIVFCRDEATYELFQKKFKGVKAFFTPDMVPYIAGAGEKMNRSGCLFIFRDDLEGLNREQMMYRIKGYLLDRGLDVNESSTLVKRRVNKKTRQKELLGKWKELSSARLVITDRLHGMIFCAITGTPCIAFDNVSHKVRDGYEWLTYLPYVKFCSDENKIVELIDILLKSNIINGYDRQPLENYYSMIKEMVVNVFYKE